MKKLILWFIPVLFVFACSTQKGVIKIESNSNDEIVDDSVEYDLEALDAKFDSWYTMHNTPATYRSLSYYKNWNDQYVIVWNNKTTGTKGTFFEPIVGYDPNIDYGFEFNHKLFYYFQYVENVMKIKILPGGPRVIN